MILRRVTKQKVEIINYLSSVTCHPTAEIIYKEVSKILPDVTLATVYRNLNLLTGDGKILRLEINGEYHFDADLSKHQHCICKNCKKIVDVFESKIDNYAIKNFKSDNFQADRVSIMYQGNCKDCILGR